MSDDELLSTNTTAARLREEIEAARAQVRRLLKEGAGRQIMSVQEAFAAAYTERIRREEREGRPTRPPVKGPRLWYALWTLAFVKEVRSERLGLFWWFAEPLLLIMVYTFMTLLFFGGNVAGMPAFPFAIIGVANFLTFRLTFMTTANGTGHLTHAMHDPSVSRFDVLMGQAPRSMVANACVAGALLSALIWNGMIPLPQDPGTVVLGLVFAGAIGFSLGLAMSLLRFIYPGVRRIYPPIVRVVALSSGLFYVSEQLPAEFKALVLWNPILHASQLSRDAWFNVYTSTDASLTYVLVFVLASIVLGLSLAIMERRRRGEQGDVE